MCGWLVGQCGDGVCVAGLWGSKVVECVWLVGGVVWWLVGGAVWWWSECGWSVGQCGDEICVVGGVVW